jgi:PAS domain S-box-containing protein
VGTSLKAELLLSIAVTVTSEQRVESVLQKTVQGLAAQKGVALTRIWLLPSIHLPSSWQPADAADVEDLHLVASAGTPINSPGENWSFLQGRFARVPMHVGKVGQVAAERHPILIKDIALENSWIVRPEWAKREAIRSFAGYPLIFRDNLLGVIAIFSRESLEDQEFAWLGLFANHAAVAIANTRAFEDLYKAEEALQSNEHNLRNALDEIQQSESKLRQVIDAIPALAWCNLPDGPNEFLNKGWHEYTGLSVEQSHGWGWQTAFHPDDLPPLMEKWMKMLTSGEPDEIEARLRRHDGVYRWFLIRAQPFRDESGKIMRWYGTSTDIDDRKQADTLLAGEQRLLEMMASGCLLSDVLHALCWFVEDMAGQCYCSVYLIDPSGTKFQNAAAPSLPSSFNDPIEGAPVAVETGPCGMAACLKTQVVAADVASDQRWPASSVFRPLALAHGFRSCSSTPILSLAGDVLGTFAIYQDEPASPTPLQQDLIARFTHIASIAIERANSEAERKAAEEALTRARSELAHMARVTTLSALTASIAHEINQPISGAVASAGACLRWLNRDQPEVQRAREAAMRIEEDGKRAAEIITHLKSFYKKDVSPERELVSVNDVVGEMLVLLRSEAARHSVTMRMEPAADLPLVRADRVQLQQVLMNLMLNGMEAMSEQEGELKITTRGEGGEVMVSVSDTGAGIPADKMEEIFDAFVTTKAGGTGMGLAISSTIIESHGGRLWATANPGRGVTFNFTLPTELEAHT